LQNVKRIHIAEDEDLAKLHTALGGCVFRGQADSNWQLTSSLERICKRHGVPSRDIAERERNALFEFQRRAHHHLRDCPDHRSLLEWLALMQHHGGPTRLVDVTHSIFVATFFSIEDASGDSVVWAFNNGRLTSSGEPEGPRSPESDGIKKANSVLAGNAEASGVSLVKPFRLNRRLADQQGAFIMPMSVEKPFQAQLSEQLEVNLSAFDDVSIDNCATKLLMAHAVQIVVPKMIHSRVLRFLSAANVSAVTLFGGLDGFARSLKTTFRAYD
jgi:hypothetical protein